MITNLQALLTSLLDSMAQPGCLLKLLIGFFGLIHWKTVMIIQISSIWLHLDFHMNTPPAHKDTEHCFCFQDPIRARGSQH